MTALRASGDHLQSVIHARPADMDSQAVGEAIARRMEILDVLDLTDEASRQAGIAITARQGIRPHAGLASG